MELLPIKTPVLKAGDSLASILMDSADIHDGDIVVVSSKAVATVENAAISLADITVSKKAKRLEKKYKKSADYYQAVLDETQRMNGTIIQSVSGIVLTELRPDGLQEGSILVPNAGLDRSNIADGYVIGWPKDPIESAQKIRTAIDRDIAVIITDSGLFPRRKGVISFALTVAGFDPFASMIGQPDLFGRAIHVTEEALADQLATAANFLMGNTNQSTPAVAIRGHGIPFNDFSGWVQGIEREKDMYHKVI
jgi:coenzyme F420-0:L-glutamate ligase